jgi:hypothetical protein
MPLPPPDPSADQRTRNPARIMLDSPLAAASRARVRHQRTRQRPPERGLRAIAVVGAFVVHMVFLFGFVLGPAYQPMPPPESDEPFLQVRLIEPPPPPPPPPVRGTPPKERGPRHQGHPGKPVASNLHSETTQAVAAAPVPVAAVPVIASASKPHASTPKPAATPLPPASLPQPAPTPELQPVPLAGEPPTVSVPTPTLQPPVPPRFQPESVRRPQLEGTRPLLPPASLALPELPVQAAAPITVSSMTLTAELPKSIAPASVNPVRADMPVAPPVPELQPIPLPTQPSPRVNLQATVTPPAPTVPREQPRIQAPVIDTIEAELASVPLAPATPAPIHAQAPAVKIAIDASVLKAAVHTSIERPQVSAPAVVALAPAPTAPVSASKPTESATAANEQPVPSSSPATATDAGDSNDVSRAPEATPQGSDSAAPGQPGAAPAAAADSDKNSAAATTAAEQGIDNGDRGTQTSVGQPGGNQPGADQGAKQGELGSYVQLRPHGDTQIMNHGTPNIGYQPTRFDKDWAPQDESSIDTALRHAVEKTTLKHTFHLPRGVRIECTVMPLLPIALFGCGNPDPPPKPVDPKVYERLYLAPASPLAPPAPVASSAAPTPAPMIKIDNSAECAVARVAGSPPPPGCEGIVLPIKPAARPASSSSSWVPASDQFH